jgi:hypothetical protein
MGLRGYVQLGACSRVLPHHAFPQVECTVTAPCLLVCWGRLEKVGSSILIRHNCCGRAIGKTACSWDKTSAKLASIDCRLSATSLAPVTCLSTAAAVEACKPSAPCIPLVKAGINLRGYLMHVFMHEIFLGRKMHELLLRLL